MSMYISLYSSMYWTCSILIFLHNYRTLHFWSSHYTYSHIHVYWWIQPNWIMIIESIYSLHIRILIRIIDKNYIYIKEYNKYRLFVPLYQAPLLFLQATPLLYFNVCTLVWLISICSSNISSHLLSICMTKIFRIKQNSSKP